MKLINAVRPIAANKIVIDFFLFIRLFFLWGQNSDSQNVFSTDLSHSTIIKKSKADSKDKKRLLFTIRSLERPASGLRAGYCKIITNYSITYCLFLVYNIFEVI